jgi:putative metallohydrolase (TIGR04338 family)
MGRPRLQAAAYEAEDRLAARLQRASPLGERCLSKTNVTLTDVRRYLAAVQAEPWFRAAWPNETRLITVKTSSAGSSSERRNRTLRSSTAHRRRRPLAELVLLHELAHMITKEPWEGRPERLLDSRLSRGHTKAWRDHYARLVGQTFGPKWARRLRQEMDREPGLCTCDGRHMSPACREFGAHPCP